MKGVNEMEEKRNSMRMSLSAQLLIKNMGDNLLEEEVEIEVLDVSKTGVGFICDRPLEIGAVYETNLKIWTDEVIHAFLKVVRIEQTKEEKYICGTIFIGLPEMNAKRIEVYDMLKRMEMGNLE
ncbi:PilZ domain-containing protein [Sporofaciens sp. JLR.KK001]|uniref:PilZ domain-containing protein n=1 Tax=Sporofaciens sp. JLR.KK001 TaxID=3112621 RepID=UPI002FF00068